MRKILADENRKIFREKVKFGKFSTESEIFSETEGNLKQGEMHHCLRGDGRPCFGHVFLAIAEHCRALVSVVRHQVLISLFLLEQEEIIPA